MQPQVWDLQDTAGAKRYDCLSKRAEQLWSDSYHRLLRRPAPCYRSQPRTSGDDDFRLSLRFTGSNAESELIASARDNQNRSRRRIENSDKLQCATVRF
jgi:hypothetical protein